VACDDVFVYRARLEKRTGAAVMRSFERTGIRMDGFAARARAWAWLASLALCFAAAAASAQSPQKVRVMLATKDTSQRLQVFFLTKGAVARGLFLPFGNIGNAIAYDARNDDYNKAIGPFDRRPTLVAAIRKAFESKYPVFEIVDDGASYQGDDERKAIIARAKSQGIAHVLLVDDQFTGITSGGYASDTHDVSAAAALRYELYETAKGERLTKDKIAANGLARIPLEQALTDRAFLEAQLPAVHDAMAKLVVGGLVRTDNLHRMAASAGLGDQVPALGGVLKRYEKPVRITMTAPAGWRTLKFNTRYAMLTEPKDERRFKMGVRTDVDVLIQELGQDVDTIEAYLQIAFARLAEAGYDTSTVQERTDLHKDGYTAISIRNPATGGGQVILFKKLDDTYVAVITVVAIENLDGTVATHLAQFQAAIDGVKVVVD
jgi:hypothetical protein